MMSHRPRRHMRVRRLPLLAQRIMHRVGYVNSFLIIGWAYNYVR